MENRRTILCETANRSQRQQVLLVYGSIGLEVNVHHQNGQPILDCIMPYLIHPPVGPAENFLYSYSKVILMHMHVQGNDRNQLGSFC